MPARKRLFLSHASADKALADLLRNTLILGGVPEDRIFYSSSRGTGIPSGEDVSTYLRQKLRQAGLVIELLSETFLVRPICLMELGGAWTLGTPTYPIVVPPLTRGKAILQIGNIQMGMLGTDEEINDIFNELHGRVAQDLDVQCYLTAWNQAIASFKEQLPSRLAAAQAGASAALDSQRNTKRSRSGSPEGAQPELSRSARAIKSRIVHALDEVWDSVDGVYSGRAEEDRYDSLIGALKLLQSIWVEILRTIDDEPRLMDAILEDTHQFVKGTRNVLEQGVSRLDSPSAAALFDELRDEENYRYELYANDLARYRAQQLKDLDAVLQRRRKYIPILRDLQAQASTILDHLLQK
jgi:hypothetical protein